MGYAFNLVVVLVVIGAILYQQLRTNPHAVLVYSNFINSFDDQTSYNLHQHPFLHGAFAPVDKELKNVPVEVVEGAIPKDLSGLFLRVGPNPIPTHVDRGYHLFDGHGMIHSLRFKDGTAVYSNQWVDTNSYKLSRLYDQPIFLQFGELHGVVGLIKAITVLPLIYNVFQTPNYRSGAANTAFLFYENRLFACHEGSLPWEIQWQEDNTFQDIGYEDFNNTLNYAVTAHAKKDPVDHHLYFNGYNADPSQPPFKYGKVENNHLTAYFEVNSGSGARSFSHDMMITERYVLIFESSVVFDLGELLSGRILKFNETNPLRIGVLPKTATSNDEVTWFAFSRPYSLVHALNAWEEENLEGEQEIVLYTPLALNFVFNGAQNTSANDVYQMTELRMNLKTGATTERFFAEAKESIEFPNVHPNYIGRKSQFGFAGEFTADTPNSFQGIVKYDLFAKKVAGKIALPEGWLCGEPVLIPKTGEAGLPSDGVYVASFANHVTESKSEWFLYDGETMDAKPVVRLAAPGVRVPVGFHGTYLSEEQLQAHLELKRNK